MPYNQTRMGIHTPLSFLLVFKISKQRKWIAIPSPLFSSLLFSSPNPSYHLLFSLLKLPNLAEFMCKFLLTFWSLKVNMYGYYFVYDLLTGSFHRSGFKPRRSLEIILFTSEEPTRFGISCLGRSLYWQYLSICLC